MIRPALLLLSVAPLLAGPLTSRTPYHGASDLVAKPDGAVLAEAWFSHSAGLQKALEHASVTIELQRGATWETVGVGRTDGEGRVAVAFNAPATPGRYPLRWTAKGQAAEATLHVVAGNVPVTVFDIDGTLTTSDSENFKDYARRLVRNPKAEGPKLRAGAVDAVRRAAALGPVVYLSGRAPWLGRPTREWLAFHQLPEGIVLLMPEARDILPTDSRVGRAKTERLQALKALGLTFRAAYGNARTDIHAYAALGIDKAKTFILGKHGGEEGTVKLGEAFPATE
jgi:phosphatidate phosphatase APP1